jgi:nucleoside-diphosphate-sugar epimerase
MMFMDDAIKATTDLMQASSDNLSIRSSYNLSAISFTPKEIFESIKRQLPDFSITYNPDFRQAIADSWPSSIDDSVARKDWNWQHNCDLDTMTNVMLKALKEKYKS